MTDKPYRLPDGSVLRSKLTKLDYKVEYDDNDQLRLRLFHPGTNRLSDTLLGNMYNPEMYDLVHT